MKKFIEINTELYNRIKRNPGGCKLNCVSKE